MTRSSHSTIIIPAHLASCIRTATPSTGLLLGSFHETKYILKQLVIVPWNESLALKTFYSEPELLVIGWFAQVADEVLTDGMNDLLGHFKDTNLEMGLVRMCNKFYGYSLIDEAVQECDVKIMKRTGLPSFLQECYDLEPFIHDIPSSNQNEGNNSQIENNSTLLNNHLIESYNQSCLDYEITVELYRLLMLPDDVLIKRLQLLDAFEERKRRLESCFKDPTLTPEQLMQCLASVKK